jgi:hypothetical protein
MLDSSYYQWTMGDATMFVRKLSEIVVPFGYEVAIAGSVLKTGRSMKNLDVVLFPTCIGKEDEKSLTNALQAFGMRMTHGAERVRKGWGEKGARDTKHIEVWDYNGKRVHLFFLK